jgi:hypothetical protein
LKNGVKYSKMETLQTERLPERGTA